MASSKYTNDQIASDYQLWGEYADPGNTMTEEEFNEMSYAEKIEILESL